MKKTVALFLAISFIFCVVAAPLSHAGPWTLKKGKLWTELYGKYFFSKNYADPKAKAHKWGDGGFSRIYNLEGKIEYGITDKLNCRLSIPYVWSYWKNDWGKVRADWGKFKHEGFQHIGLALKYRFLEKPLTMAAWGQVLIQPRSTDTVAPPDIMEYGDGIEARCLIGKSFHVFKKPAYVSTELGYLWRTDWIAKSPYANQMIVFGEGGIAIFDWLMIKSEVDMRYSHMRTGNRKDTLTWRIGPIFNLLGKGFSEVYKGGDASLNLELQYGRTMWARGDGRGTGGVDNEKFHSVSLADEYIAKIQVLW